MQAVAETGTPVKPQDRERSIAEAAYFLAERRNFEPGDPLADWLAAERAIDRSRLSPREQQEVDLYEELRQRVGSALADISGTVDAQSVRHAFEQAASKLQATGTFAAESVARIAASMRKDFAHAATKLGPDWQDFTDRSQDLLGICRDRGNLFLGQTARAAAEWLQHAGTKLQPTYKTGEMVYHGSFDCTACGELLALQHSAHLPPCPKCQGVEFRRH